MFSPQLQCSLPVTRLRGQLLAAGAAFHHRLTGARDQFQCIIDVDEDVEDEKEESEARGGVMPMTRDRKQPPSRELGISGDGPPGDGRGA